MLCNRAIFKNDNAYLVQFDLPGVTEDNLEVTIENDQLFLKAKREDQLKGKRILGEIPKLHIKRSLHLGSSVDREAITAKLNNGVLSITLPKKKKAKKIIINAA